MSTQMNSSERSPKHELNKNEQNHLDELKSNNGKFNDQQHVSYHSMPAGDEVGSWRTTDESSLIGNGSLDNNSSDEDEEVYGSERFVYASLEMSDDQRQATAELYNLKLDLGFNAGDGSSIMDYTERIRKLNEDLLNDPIPPELENRERSIKFKETLVDFIAPTPDLDLYTFDSEPLQETSPNIDSVESGPRSSLDSDFTAGQQSEYVDRPANQDLVSVDLVARTSPGESNSLGPEPKVPEASQEEETVPKEATSSEIVPSRASNEDEKPSDNPSEELERNKPLEELTFIEQNGKFRVATSYELSAVQSSPRDNTLRSPRRPSNSKSLHPRPPSTPRAPTADHSYRRYQRSASARQPGSARTVGLGQSGSNGTAFRFGQSAASSRSASSMQTESSRSVVASRVRYNRSAVSKQQSMENERMREAEEEERKRKKKLANETAFKAWLRHKKAESEARQTANQEQPDQSTDSVANKSEGKTSFDEWLKMKEAQKRREQRFQEAEKTYLATTSPRGSDADRAFRQWLKRKQQEKNYQKEQERQRSTLHSLMSRRSRKSIALARAIHHAHSLRFAEYWNPYEH